MTIAQLQAQIGLNNAQFLTGISQSSSAWKGLQGVLALGGAAGAAGAGAAAITNSVIDMGKQIIQTTIDFQEGLGQIASLTGQTGAALDSLKSVATDSFLHMTQDIKEVSAATAILTDRTHLTGKALEGLLQTEGNISRATGENLTKLIESSSLAMNKWGVAGKDMAAEMDTLMGISQRTGVSITTLTDFIKRGGAQFQDMGLNINQAAQMMADMESHGINSAQVMMGLRQAVSSLAAAGIPSNEMLQATVRLLENTKDPAKRLDEAIHLLGKRTGEELVEAMKLGTIGTKNWTAEIDKAKDASKKAADQANPLKDSITEVGHAFQELIALSAGDANGLAAYFHNAATAIKEAKPYIDSTAATMKWMFEHSPEGMAQKLMTMAGKANGPADTQTPDVTSKEQDTHARYMKYRADETAATKKWEKDNIDALNEVNIANHQFTAQQDEEAKIREKADAAVLKASLGKQKPHKNTPYENELKEFKLEKERLIEEYKELDQGTEAVAARLIARFKDMSRAQKDWLRSEVHQIDQQKQHFADEAKMKSLTAETTAQILQLQDQLRDGDKYTVESIKHLFKDPKKMSEETLIALTALMNERQKDNAQLVLHNEHIQEEQQRQKEAARAISDARLEYERITHTRYEDIAALQLYGRTFAEITELDHMGSALHLAYELERLANLKSYNAETKKTKDAEESLIKTLDELHLKLSLKTPLEETAQATKAALTEFDKLPERVQLIEENALADKEFGKSIEELSYEEMFFVDQVLAATHALAIKTKSDQDAEAATKRHASAMEELSKKYAENSQRIKELSSHATTKQPKWITDFMQANLKSLSDEEFMFAALVAQQDKQKQSLEQHATAVKKLTAELKHEFTKVFEDMMHGGKNAFTTLEQDFTKMLQKMAAEELAGRLADFLGGLAEKFLPGFKSVKGHATGGYLQPGELAMVGERGPELFRPNTAGQVIPNNQISGGGGGGVTVNMTVNAQDANSFRYSQNQIAQSLASTLQRAQMRNG